MKLVSRHLLDEGFPIPEDAVVRINTAWEPSLELMCKQIEETNRDIFIDISQFRRKPPCHRWSIEQLLFIFNSYQHVKYCAVSNVEEVDDIMYGIWKLPKHVNVVPKIESIAGINNIESIVSVLREPKIIMLDVEDLYTDILNKGAEGKDLYKVFVNPFYRKCQELGVMVLKISGVIFQEMTKEVG